MKKYQTYFKDKEEIKFAGPVIPEYLKEVFEHQGYECCELVKKIPASEEMNEKDRFVNEN